MSFNDCISEFFPYLAHAIYHAVMVLFLNKADMCVRNPVISNDPNKMSLAELKGPLRVWSLQLQGLILKAFFLDLYFKLDLRSFLMVGSLSTNEHA